MTIKLLIFFSILFSCTETKQERNTKTSSSTPDIKDIPVDIPQEASFEQNFSTSEEQTQSEAVSSANKELGIYINAPTGTVLGIDKLNLKIREFSGFESNGRGVLLASKGSIEVSNEKGALISEDSFSDNMKAVLEVSSDELNEINNNLGVVLRTENDGIKTIPPSSLVWQSIDDERTIVSFPFAGGNVDFQLIKLENKTFGSTDIYIPRPAEAINLKAMAMSSSSIKLQWGNPGGVVSAYKIVYSILQDEIFNQPSCKEGKAIDNIVGTANEYLIEDLAANVSYFFRLCSKNNAYPEPDISPGILISEKTLESSVPVLHLLAMDGNAGLHHINAVDGVWDESSVAFASASSWGRFVTFELDMENKPTVFFDGLDRKVKYFKKDSSWSLVKNFEYDAFTHINSLEQLMQDRRSYQIHPISFVINRDNEMQIFYSGFEQSSENCTSDISTHNLCFGFYQFNNSTENWNLLERQNTYFSLASSTKYFLVDANKDIHWFHYTAANSKLSHYQLAGNNLSVENFDNQNCYSYSNNYDNFRVYENPNLLETYFLGKVDTNGKLHIAYHCSDLAGKISLYYASNMGSSNWQHYLVVNNDEGGVGVNDIAISRNGEKILIAGNNGVVFEKQSNNEFKAIITLGNVEISNPSYKFIPPLVTQSEITGYGGMPEGTFLLSNFSIGIDKDGFYHILIAGGRLQSDGRQFLPTPFFYINNRSGEWSTLTEIKALIPEWRGNNLISFQIEGMPSRFYRP